MSEQTRSNVKAEEAAALLDQTFRHRRVIHRTCEKTRDALLYAIETSPRESIITLIGPSGVGKSIVVELVQKRLIERYGQEMKDDPGFLPFISVTAVTGLSGSYDWRDGFARLLTSAGEPLVGLKQSLPLLELDGQKILTTKGLLKSEFRRAFESLVKNRRVKVVFLDEGSAVIDESVNRHPLRQYNILKSLAVTLGIVIVLVGAYDLAGIREGNGQLLARTTCLHMQRYRPDVDRLQQDVTGQFTPESKDDEDDYGSFMSAAAALKSIAPVEFDAGVIEDMPYVVTKSAGCVGILCDWVDRASVRALTHNGGRVTRQIFEETSLPNSVVIKLATEAALGESQLTDCTEEALTQHFGLTAIRAKFEVKAETRRPPSARKAPVGKRGPSRDPVGMTHG